MAEQRERDDEEQQRQQHSHGARHEVLAVEQGVQGVIGYDAAGLQSRVGVVHVFSHVADEHHLVLCKHGEVGVGVTLQDVASQVVVSLVAALVILREGFCWKVQERAVVAQSAVASVKESVTRDGLPGHLPVCVQRHRRLAVVEVFVGVPVIPSSSSTVTIIRSGP